MRTRTRPKDIARDLAGLRAELDRVRAEIRRYRDSLHVEFRQADDGCIEYALFAGGTQESVWFGVPGIYAH